MVNYSRAHNWTIRVHGLSPINRSLDAWPHGHWPSWISSLPASAYTAWPLRLLPRAAHITTRRSKSPIVPPSWPAYLVHSVIRDLLSKYSQVWPQSALDTGPSLFATSAQAYWRNLIHFVQMTTDFLLHERDLIRIFFLSFPALYQSAHQTFQRIAILNEKCRKPCENDRIAPLLGLWLQGSALVKLPFPISRPSMTHIRGQGWGFNGGGERIRDLSSFLPVRAKGTLCRLSATTCLFSGMNSQWSLKDQEQQPVASLSTTLLQNYLC